MAAEPAKGVAIKSGRSAVLQLINSFILLDGKVMLLLFLFMMPSSKGAFGTSPIESLVWPKPQIHEFRTGANCTRFHISSEETFQFSSSSNSTILTKLFARYSAILAQQRRHSATTQGERSAGTSIRAAHAGRTNSNTIDTVSVRVLSHNEVLNLETSERYEIDIAAPETRIVSDTVYGAIRAVETFAQLVQLNMTIVAGQHIEDWPRFPFRGILIDTVSIRVLV